LFIVTDTNNYDIQNIPKIIDELEKLLNNQFNNEGSGWALASAENIIKAYVKI
jgi:hypothetical protein